MTSDRDLILKDLQPLIDLAYEGLDRGMAVARQFFEGDGKPVDIVLFNDIVRYEVKQYLSDKGHTVEEEYQPEEIANIGLGMVFGKYHVRMWKSRDGEIPPPGRSRNKWRFFDQLVQGEFEFPGLPRPTEANIALLWRLGPGYQFDGLWAAYPKSASGRYSPVDVHWSQPVSHSSLGPISLGLDQLTQVEAHDLPFEMCDDEEGHAERTG